MTKLTMMDLPRARDNKTFFCKVCKEFVPEEKKHNRKRHELAGVRK